MATQPSDTAPAPQAAPPRLLFCATVFLSAFLLFLVQPLIARFILPWFGSSPGVWATCMLFFQVLLLGGYAYAHWLVNRRRGTWQAAVHTLLLGLALLTLPITPAASLRPEGGEPPLLAILAVLGLSVGAPYLLLSSTGPLLQGWFARLAPGASPYRLYALSNVGSLLALLSYPLAIEPALRLRQQTLAWSAGFALFALLCAACAWQLRRRDAASPSGAAPAAAPSAGDAAVNLPRLDASEVLAWLMLPACASGLLLATTNQMCLDVAVVPFLWVLPLGLYLLTFALAFDADRWYVRPLFCALLPAALINVVRLLRAGVDAGIVEQVVGYSLALFVFCMCLHGELARRRPHPRRLTLYFLVVSIGGALGGLFVAVAAPAFFSGFYEYGILLVGGYALLMLLMLRQALRPAGPSEGRGRRVARAAAALGWLCCAGAILYGAAVFFRASFWIGDAPDERERAQLLFWLRRGLHAALLLPPLLIVGMDSTRQKLKAPLRDWWLAPRRAAAAAMVPLASLGLVALAGSLGWLSRTHSSRIAQGRNFYGVLTIQEYAPQTPDHDWTLRHGRITHGYQLKENPDWPVGYYAPVTGIGWAIRRHPLRELEGRQFRIGVVGLGTGTLAAYANARVAPASTNEPYTQPWSRTPPDYIRFYEINPLVQDWAGRHFSYLADARRRGADVDVYLGDARLVLERQIERGEGQRFDVLAIDAFTGDAIPIHLLTRESLALYWQHLKPDGILAVHVSNRFLDLPPVVRRLGEELGKTVLQLDNDDIDEQSVTGSRWILVTGNHGFLADPDVRLYETELAPAGPLWSDDFSSVFALLKRPEAVEEPPADTGE